MTLHLQLRANNQGGAERYHGMVKIPPARRNPARKARRDTRETPESQETELEEGGNLPAFGMVYGYQQHSHESDEDTVSEDSDNDMEDVDQNSKLLHSLLFYVVLISIHDY
jgi:hypothetical protein